MRPGVEAYLEKVNEASERLEGYAEVAKDVLELRKMSDEEVRLENFSFSQLFLDKSDPVQKKLDDMNRFAYGAFTLFFNLANNRRIASYNYREEIHEKVKSRTLTQEEYEHIRDTPVKVLMKEVVSKYFPGDRK